MSFKLSKYVFVTGTITDKKSTEAFRLAFSTRTGKLLRIPEGLYATMEQQPVDQLPESVINNLINLEMLVPDEEDELRYILDKSRDCATDKGCLTLLMDPGHVSQSHAMVGRIKEDMSRMVTREKLKQVIMLWLLPEHFTGHHRLIELADDYRIFLQKNGTSVKRHIIGDISQFHWLMELGALSGEMERLELIISDMDRFLSNADAEATLKRFFAFCSSRSENCTFRLKIYGRHIETGSYRDWIPQLQQWSAGTKVEILVIPNEDGDAAMNGQSMELVRYLHSATRFPVYLVPAVSFRHLRSSAPQPRLRETRQFLLRTDELAERQDYSQWGFPGTIVKRNFSTKAFEQQLLKGEVRCSGCAFLPFCGGCEKSLWEKGLAPCPPYKESFTELLKIISKID